MIQAENNNVSLTEFSNFTGLFMEDVNTCYGGRYKHTTNGFPFLLLNYSQINPSVRTLLLYRHLYIMDSY